MTPEEFQKEMIILRESNGNGQSPEYFHIQADSLMCKLLEGLGYGEGIKIFKEQEKWYS